MRVANFYVDAWCSEGAVHTYHSAMADIEAGRNLHTTQMCLLNKVKDYDLIRIHSVYDLIEISNKYDGTYYCNRTRRTLRRVNDFFHLWENGEFDR